MEVEMDSPPPDHTLTNRMRMKVKAILSPPNVSITLLVFPSLDLEPLSPPLIRNVDDYKTCRLCESDNGSLQPEPSECIQMVREMMSQVGLELSEEDLTFCPFCASQLQGLVRLRKEIDRLGNRLCSMLIGLQSLFSTTTTLTTPLNREEEIAMHETLSPEENDVIPVCINAVPNMSERNLQVSKSVPNFNFVSQTREKPYSCHACCKTFNRHCSLRRHVTNEHSPPDEEEEEESFSENDSSSTLGLAHNEKVQSPNRHSEFSSKFGLGRHYSTHIPVDERPYSCSMCPRRFAQKQHLRYHSYTHLPIHVRPFPCPHCPSRFITKELLKRHHDKKTSCSKHFQDSESLTAHSFTRLKRRRMPCPHCYRTFTTAEALRRHSVIHDGEGPKNCCLVCDETFTRHSSLKRHLLSAHGVTQRHTVAKSKSPAKCHSRRYACSVCSRTFNLPYKLKQHAKIHTGERPYPCRICLVRFARKDSLLRHSYIHLPKEDWPFPCPHCPRRFIQMSCFRIHVKTHFPTDEETYLYSSRWRPKPPAPEELWRTDGVETREAGDGEEESKTGSILLGEVDVGDSLGKTGSIINGICDGLEQVDNSNANNLDFFDGSEVDKHKLEYRPEDSPLSSTHWKDFQEEL